MQTRDVGELTLYVLCHPLFKRPSENDCDMQLAHYFEDEKLQSVSDSVSNLQVIYTGLSKE